MSAIKSQVASVSVFSDGVTKRVKIKVQRPNREILTTEIPVTHNVSKGSVYFIVRTELGISPSGLEIPLHIDRNLPIVI